MATESSQRRRPTVAVIGLGAMGLVGVKNLLEEGFDVTGFERNGYIGGLWHFTDDEDTLSVLESTQTNVSVDRGCFTDFPFPPGTPPFCPAKQVEQYLESYADHFSLRPHLRLNAAVTAVVREEQLERWRVSFADAPSQVFDKVLVATGPHARPMMPRFEGQGAFAGRIIHSRSFKRPEAFDGMHIVVVGLGNTAGDIADCLVGHAASIYISHNRGAIILPRLDNGVPITSRITRRHALFLARLDYWLPALAERVLNRMAKRTMEKAFSPIEESWNLDSAPSVRVTIPVVSDTLVAHLRSGAVRSVAGIKRVTGPSEIELSDGQRVEADAIICCTGFKKDFTMIDPRYDPTKNMSPAWLAAPGSHDRPLPRLYQNLFSLQAPSSLAFLGCVWFATGAFFLADLSSMCIAQVWAGRAALPPAGEMERWAARQEDAVTRLARRGTVIPSSVPQRQWLVWADETAGARLEEHLGWGWRAWWFWWSERRLWRLLMDGLMTAAVWRLFAGRRRRRWDGAMGEIERMNGEAARHKSKRD